MFCVIETWLRAAGDEAKCRELSHPGYTTTSFSRPSRGGGIAFVVSDSLRPYATFESEFSFHHSSFELCQLTLAFQHTHLIIFCLYRPPPNKKNQLTDAMFIEQFQDFFEYASTLKGKLLVVGDFSFHFDSPSNVRTSKLQDIISTFHLSQSVTLLIHIHGHIIDWVLRKEEECILKSLSVDSILTTDHSCVVLP